MKAIEKILLIINDIKNHYYGQYGKDVIWNSAEQDVFFLNCDAEVLHWLEKNQIELHDDVYEYGITYGILIIKKEIDFKMARKYGGVLEIAQKEEYFELLNKTIYNYLTEGVTNAH